MRDERKTFEPRSDGAHPEVGARMSLLTRVMLTNGAVLVIALLILALSPVTVSHPLALGEVVVLVTGVTALMVVNLFLFRRTFAPVERLTEVMRTVDLLEPGRRIPVYGEAAEVAELTQAFNEMLDRLEEERRLSARRALSAQEGERHRVAQELHDEVGQTLTAVLLQLERVQRTAPDGLREELEEVRETARASLEEVRQIAQRLRPEALDELGLQSALAALAERVSGQGGLSVVRDLDGPLPRLTPEAELVIYRVAQEGLTNALRHADASEAVLTLRRDGGGVTLTVADDGRGLDGSDAGAGIQGMRERALLAGGRVDVRNRAEGGAEVRLELPVRPE